MNSGVVGNISFWSECFFLPGPLVPYTRPIALGLCSILKIKFLQSMSQNL